MWLAGILTTLFYYCVDPGAKYKAAIIKCDHRGGCPGWVGLCGWLGGILTPILYYSVDPGAQYKTAIHNERRISGEAVRTAAVY